MEYFVRVFTCRFLYFPIFVFSGAAKLISASTHLAVLDQSDGIFGVSTRTLLVCVGTLELLVAIGMTSKRSSVFKHGLVLWLASQFLLYRCVTLLAGIGTPCPCLGNVAYWLSLPPKRLDEISLSSAIILFIVSALCLWLSKSLNDYGLLENATEVCK